MTSDEKDFLPPSYSESEGQGPSHISSSTSPSTNRGQSLLDQLTLTRATQIRSIIENNILPIVEEQASYGIAQTTIALLPSDIPLPAIEEKNEFSFETTSSAKSVEIIGFTSELAPKIVRLEGHMNRTEFWRVQAVITDLERVLSESLNASPVLRSPISPTRERRFDAWPGTSSQQAPGRTRGLLSRVMPSLGPEQKSPGGNPEVGLRKSGIEESVREEVGLVLVKARLEEICLRTVNEFGLYDTMNKQCVIVRVDARC